MFVVATPLFTLPTLTLALTLTPTLGCQLAYVLPERLCITSWPDP